MTRIPAVVLSSLVALAMLAPRVEASVQTTDFIVDATRTNFMGFEPLPDGTIFVTTYIEDGLRIQQVKSSPNGTWTTYQAVEGINGWYPNGGDFGFTQITMLDGSDFFDVGFYRGSGNGSHASLFYELYDDGSLVDSGSVAHQVFPMSYLGFSGGGFDTILLRDGDPTAATSVQDGTHNALSLDAIETFRPAVIDPVPEATSLAIWGSIVAIGIAARYRRTK